MEIAGKAGSFQDVPVLGMNSGYGNRVTPQAVYGFPRDYAAHLVNSWTVDRRAYPVTGIEYAHRPHVYLSCCGVPMALVPLLARVQYPQVRTRTPPWSGMRW